MRLDRQKLCESEHDEWRHSKSCVRRRNMIFERASHYFVLVIIVKSVSSTVKTWFCDPRVWSTEGPSTKTKTCRTSKRISTHVCTGLAFLAVKTPQIGRSRTKGCAPWLMVLGCQFLACSQLDPSMLKPTMCVIRWTSGCNHSYVSQVSSENGLARFLHRPIIMSSLSLLPEFAVFLA